MQPRRPGRRRAGGLATARVRRHCSTSRWHRWARSTASCSARRGGGPTAENRPGFRSPPQPAHRGRRPPSPPTKATRRAVPPATRSRTHSTPVRVFPKPRPARTSHVRQSDSGGRWAAWPWDARDTRRAVGRMGRLFRTSRRSRACEGRGSSSRQSAQAVRPWRPGPLMASPWPWPIPRAPRSDPPARHRSRPEPRWSGSPYKPPVRPWGLCPSPARGACWPPSTLDAARTPTAWLTIRSLSVRTSATKAGSFSRVKDGPQPHIGTPGRLDAGASFGQGQGQHFVFVAGLCESCRSCWPYHRVRYGSNVAKNDIWKSRRGVN